MREGEKQRPGTPLEAVKSCSENPPAASLCKPGRTRSQGWPSPRTGTPPGWHHEWICTAPIDRERAKTYILIQTWLKVMMSEWVSHSLCNYSIQFEAFMWICCCVHDWQDINGLKCIYCNQPVTVTWRHCFLWFFTFIFEMSSSEASLWIIHWCCC